MTEASASPNEAGVGWNESFDKLARDCDELNRSLEKLPGSRRRKLHCESWLSERF